MSLCLVSSVRCKVGGEASPAHSRKQIDISAPLKNTNAEVFASFLVAQVQVQVQVQEQEQEQEQVQVQEQEQVQAHLAGSQ